MNTIEQDLRALGDNADQVATTLLALGIKGEVGEPSSCPVYYYLLRKGHAQVREVTDTYIRTPEVSYDTPLAVSAFILAFDHGGYPSLDMNEE